MVCLGNICRSPLAEGILRSKLPENYVVDSAGTSNYHVDHFPDSRSIKVASENGIDISNLKARQFSVQDFDHFDRIYVMDSENYQNVIKLAKNKEEMSKVSLILNETYPNEDKNVPDPYYGNIDDFRGVYNMLDEVCEVIKNKIE